MHYFADGYSKLDIGSIKIDKIDITFNTKQASGTILTTKTNNVSLSLTSLHLGFSLF